MKEFTLRVTGKHMKKHYLVELTTEGRESNGIAFPPQHIMVMTNDRQEANVTLHASLLYHMRVSESKASTMEEFLQRKIKERVIGPVVKEETLIPKENTNLIEIIIED
ncbi:hypothetical protein SH601_04880 [Gracilibacillus sp. S3-1-1]|uniref:Uncharacterized protein n=1 Tax=Gracilibacillus pellucidus TaxID=3095368 RepID=A0ACC6M398_9BACI|nr:hypothetical protein [Gracilibacillus sp. S3-1-1]MDX8045317.1 hypothetical protein [Gracilibacillus sp. S3-1-1]